MKAPSQAISLKDIEKHVLDDAVELIATVGVANPLLHTTLVYELEGSNREVALFLRATLSRHAILVATRLHALKQTGPTGETASIESYLHYAEIEGVLSTTQAGVFRSKRKDIIQKLEAAGIPFSDLMIFRTAELAHSLHRSPMANKLASLPIWDFAHETYELVLRIEKTVSGTAVLEKKFQEWLDRGREFWPESPVP
jgi:hypothetical protein